MGQGDIRNRETIRAAIADLCARREIALLVTPYLQCQTSFVALEEDGFHLAATMGREEAIFALRSPELRMRFPYQASFLEARVALKGLGRVDARPTLRMALPDLLSDGDQRGAYRVERVGRVPVTFASSTYEIVLATLANFSTTGVRLHFQAPLGEGLRVDGKVSLSIPLTEELRFDATARVRWVMGRQAGLSFEPDLPEPLLRDLSRWVFLKREEDLTREANRLDAQALAPASPGGGARGLLLMSADAALEARLRELLEGLPPLARIPPSVQALRSLDARATPLVFLHVPSLSLDERRRLRTWAECLAGRVPFMLLGTALEPAPLFEVGNELKAVGVYALAEGPNTLFRRLVEGVLRRHRSSAHG